MRIKIRPPFRYALLAIVMAATASVALAHESEVWQTHQNLSARDTFYDGDGNYWSITFELEDHGNGYRDYSGELFARVFKQSGSYPYTYTYFYQCQREFSLEEAFNALPDDSSFVGLNTGIFFSYLYPACDGYPETTFTVYCEASETRHSTSSTARKTTYADYSPYGPKRFWIEEYEDVSSELNPGVGDHTCSLSFSNTLGSISTDFAFAHTSDGRRKVKLP